MEALLEWEQAAAIFESKYGESLGNREKITCLRRKMPPEVFGGDGKLGLFRGRSINSYEEMRSELVRYIEDRPVPTVTKTPFSSHLNVCDGFKEVLEGEDSEASRQALEQLEKCQSLYTMYKAKGTKGGGKNNNNKNGKGGDTSPNPHP